MRAAALALALVAGGLGPSFAPADPVWGCDGVGYGGAAGQGWTDLVLMVPSSEGAIQARLTLPEGKVFQGLPVCGDLDGDGDDEIVTVESDVLLGPQIAVYAKTRGRVAASLPQGDAGATMAVQGVLRSANQGLIGVVGGDGMMRIWTLVAGRLVEQGAAPGYAPGGGVRDCGTGAEWVLARADGGGIDTVRWGAGGLTATRIGTEPGDLPRLLVCVGE